MRIGEKHAFRSQLVHVGRPGLRIALEHARPVIQIIDRDEEDVRIRQAHRRRFVRSNRSQRTKQYAER